MLPPYFWRNGVLISAFKRKALRLWINPLLICLALNFDILLIHFNGIIHVAMRMLFKATCLLLEIDVLLCFITACPNSKVAYHVALMQVFPAFSLPHHLMLSVHKCHKPHLLVLKSIVAITAPGLCKALMWHLKWEPWRKIMSSVLLVNTGWNVSFFQHSW